MQPQGAPLARGGLNVLRHRPNVIWTSVPVALALVAVAVIALFAYERVTRDVVQQRDTELAKISAAWLSEGLGRYSQILQNITTSDDLSSLEPARLSSALEVAENQLSVFDAGTVVYNTDGQSLWPQRSADEQRGIEFPAPSEFDRVRRTLRPAFSDVFRDAISGDDVILVGVPILGSDNQFRGVLAGMFTIRYSLVGAMHAEALELKAGRTGFAYLVDGNGRVIYHQDGSLVGESLADAEPVARATGGETGALVTKDATGRDIVAGFAPVPGTSWALITQERWENVVGPIQGQSRLLLGTLAGGSLLAVAVAYVAMGRTLKPIRDLTGGAQRIASGDFDYVIDARAGDEVQELAQQFNTMAGSLKESYTNLEQRVADRTEALGESEERYRTLFEDSKDAIFISDVHGKVIDANQAALDIFGFTKAEAIGSDVGDRYVDQEDWERFRQEILQGGGSVRGFEVKLRKQDGTEMDCLLTATRHRDEDADGGGIQGIVRDVTERKRTEEERLQQTRELAVLQERNRVAREIHDTLAQGFTGIVLQLEAGEQALEDSPTDVPEHLSQAKNLARESLWEARRSMWNLLPHALEERDLDAAIQAEVLRFAEVGRAKAEFSPSGEKRELDADVQTALLRVCQESLNNIRCHANATKIHVALTYHPNAAVLNVQDDGLGFDFEVTSRQVV